jgi:pimeloyl-ACP methyl ester carboxylesterase
MIARRHVFHVAGYDPYDIAGQHRRFRRELAKFAGTWNVSAAASDVIGEKSWSVTTRGPNWTCETTVEPLDWHDIVLADLKKPAIPRLLAGAATCADVIASGTFARYFAASHRYAFFFLVPFADVLLFALAGALVGYALAAAQALTGVTRVVVATADAVAAFALLMRWPGRRWRVAQGLADWIFARDYMLVRRPDIEARLDQFAERVLARARAGEVDEIVVVGHSLGATFVVDLLARALARDPELCRRGPALSVLTIGATIPKIALHPAGGRLRDCARRVATEPSLFWVEYQARDDAISFYRFHPVALRAVAAETEAVQPMVRRVQLHEMMTAQAFRRHRLSFMRLHYQFVMANAQRTVYDYFMIVCGPLSLRQVASAPGGASDAIAADGALITPPRMRAGA